MKFNIVITKGYPFKVTNAKVTLLNHQRGGQAFLRVSQLL